MRSKGRKTLTNKKTNHAKKNTKNKKQKKSRNEKITANSNDLRTNHPHNHTHRDTNTTPHTDTHTLTHNQKRTQAEPQTHTHTRRDKHRQAHRKTDRNTTRPIEKSRKTSGKTKTWSTPLRSSTRVVGFEADLDSTYDSLCHLHTVRDFLMHSASPPITMITFSSSSFFFSSSSPRSARLFVVDSSFLPPNSLGMTVTGSSSWDRTVRDLFNDALGNAFLWNQLGHLSYFLPNLQNWHKNILLNNVFGISSVHVTRSMLPPSQILLVISSRCRQCSGMWKSR